MPRKTFTAGEVLAAADVNTFLMDQSVMTFADSDARGSAIPSPTEGMVTYLDDTKAIEVFNGTSFVPAAPASGGGSGNAIINGAFEINQRNFTSNTTNGYGFDRWVNFADGGTVTQSSQAFTLGSAPVIGFESANFYRNLVSGQSTSGHLSVFIQPIESVRSFANQTVTVSFYAKAGSGTPKVAVEFRQVFGTGGSPSASVSTVVAAPTISTDWARYTATVSVPSIAGKTLGTNRDDRLELNFWFSAGADFNARASSIGIQNNTFDIWGVQLEAGSTATDFRRNANSLQGELAACQRYYVQYGGKNLFEVFGNGHAESTTVARIKIAPPVEMRVPPTSITFSTVAVFDFVATLSSVTPTLSSSHLGDKSLIITATGSGLTQFRPYVLGANNSLSGFIGLSAEL
jgi:hypothetical protein